MTTASAIINRAYSLLGYKAAGETLSADDSAYALDALNSMIGSWNTQRLFIVSTTNVIGTVSAASATIGDTMTFDTARPVALMPGAFARIGGIDYPIQIITREQYAAIPLKSDTATSPQYAYYDESLPTGTVYFYPAPATAISIHLPLQTQLTEFAGLATDYDLAPGYQLALESSLAEQLAPGIREASAGLIQMARNARRAIRRTNARIPLLQSEPHAVRSDILSGA